MIKHSQNIKQQLSASDKAQNPSFMFTASTKAPNYIVNII